MKRIFTLGWVSFLLLSLIAWEWWWCWFAQAMNDSGQPLDTGDYLRVVWESGVVWLIGVTVLTAIRIAILRTPKGAGYGEWLTAICSLLFIVAACMFLGIGR